MQALEGLSDRQLDLVVAEHVFGLVPRKVKPDWYKLEVTLFSYPNDPLITYSFDENACNACMHRNGVDEKAGTARPLPFWACEDEGATEVVREMEGRGFGWEIRKLAEPVDPSRPYEARFCSATVDARASAESSARAICTAALRALAPGLV